MKPIFDVRTTTWNGKEAHDALSRVGRQIFHPGRMPYRVYLAVLNNELSFRASDSEQWFVDMRLAIEWLTRVPPPPRESDARFA